MLNWFDWLSIGIDYEDQGIDSEQNKDSMIEFIMHVELAQSNYESIQELKRMGHFHYWEFECVIESEVHIIA